MFLGHTFEWWGAFCGIAGFILAILMIPLTFVGPMTMQKLQNWWAERSVAALRERLKALETRLSNYELTYPLLDDTEDLILRALAAISSLCMGIIYLVLMNIVAIMKIAPYVDPRAAKHSTELTISMFFIMLSVSLAAFPTFFAIYGSIRVYQSKRSKRERALLRRSLDKLHAQLEKRKSYGAGISPV
jgi:hypothetical protein